jgi:hypothetical protein
MRFDALAAKLQCARTAIAQAEGDLESAIGEIRDAPRCEKVGMSEVLEAAFEELRRAKAELARVEVMIKESGT